MPVDLQLALQSSVTKTAAFNGSGVTIPTGTPRYGLKARVVYSAASTTAGAGTAIFGIDISRDGGSTWYTEFQADTLTLGTTAIAGETFIPFEVSKLTAATNDLQIRLSLETITGTGATITYFGDIVIGRP